MSTTASPRTARMKPDEQLRLRSTTRDVKAGWILVDGERVTLCNQATGEHPTGKVHFTRREFNALVDWYGREQKLYVDVTP
jgi:hypothetical protein